MEEDFILELNYKGEKYELPANIQFGIGDFSLYVSLPGVDVLIKGQEDGTSKCFYLNQAVEINKRDLNLIQLISRNINEIVF